MNIHFYVQHDVQATYVPTTYIAKHTLYIDARIRTGNTQADTIVLAESI